MRYVWRALLAVLVALGWYYMLRDIFAAAIQ